MKRVSFKTAKALKEAGYPQKLTDYNSSRYVLEDFDHYIVSPTYLEVWLWLWREKGIRMPIGYHKETFVVADEINMIEFYSKNDPEEAIVAAINYLVENNLIK